MKFIKRETQAHELEIAGNKYPAIYSMQAIAHMEDYTATHHSWSQERLALDMPTAKEIVGFCYGMLAAAGVTVEADDIAASVSPADIPELVKQIKAIVADQKAEPIKQSKNARTPEKK